MEVMGDTNSVDEDIQINAIGTIDAILTVSLLIHIKQGKILEKLQCIKHKP